MAFVLEHGFKGVPHALQVKLVPTHLNLVLLLGNLQFPLQLENCGLQVHVLLVHLDVFLLLLDHWLQLALKLQEHGFPFLGILLQLLHLLLWVFDVGCSIGGLVLRILQEFLQSWVTQLKQKEE